MINDNARKTAIFFLTVPPIMNTYIITCILNDILNNYINTYIITCILNDILNTMSDMKVDSKPNNCLETITPSMVFTRTLILTHKRRRCHKP